jgi:hypothetical protein
LWFLFVVFGLWFVACGGDVTVAVRMMLMMLMLIIYSHESWMMLVMMTTASTITMTMSDEDQGGRGLFVFFSCISGTFSVAVCGVRKQTLALLGL